MGRKKSKYKGDLGKHIIIEQPPIKPTILTAKNPKDIKKEHCENFTQWVMDNKRHIQNERSRKTGLLLEYYGISQMAEDKWYFLSMALAKDNVEGFRCVTKDNVGRDIKWDAIKHAMLYIEVQDKLAEKSDNYSISRACSHLEKRWGVNKKTLENQYKKALESPFIKTYEGIKNEFEGKKNEVGEDMASEFLKALKQANNDLH